MRRGAALVLAAAAAIVGVVVMSESTKTRPTIPGGTSQRRKQIAALIRAEAVRQGVEPRVALAFASAESGLNPAASGDLTWGEWDGGARYRQHVLDNPKFLDNPARNDPSAWHSYGLFGLLAPYHVGPREHPSILWDPLVNAQRGIATLAQLLKRTGGDVEQARLLYTGATKSPLERQQAILSRFRKLYDAWGEQPA